VFPLPCMLVCASSVRNCTRDAGAASTRSSCALNFERAKRRCKPRTQMRRENAKTISTVIASKRSNPLSPHARKDGLLRFGSNDDGDRLCLRRRLSSQSSKRIGISHAVVRTSVRNASGAPKYGTPAPASAPCPPATALTPCSRCLQHLMAARPEQGANSSRSGPYRPMMTLHLLAPFAPEPRHPAPHHQDELERPVCPPRKLWN